MRLIDADALRDALDNEPTITSDVYDILAAAPTVSCGIPSCAAHPKESSPSFCEHVWIESQTTLAGWVCRKCNEWRAS